MAKIFDWDARLGSYIDQVSGNTGTASNLLFATTEKGLSGIGNSSSTGLVYPSLDINNKNFSAEIWVKTNEVDDGFILDNRDAISDGMYAIFHATSGDFRFYINTGYVQTTNNIIKNKWYHFIVTFDNSGNAILYTDSIQDDVIDASILTLDVDNGFTLFKNNLGNFSHLNGCIGKVTFYDTILSQSEINNLYSEFLHSYPVIETKNNIVYPKPTDLSEEVYSHLETIVTSTDITTWTVVGDATLDSSTQFTTTAQFGSIFYDFDFDILKNYILIISGTTASSDLRIGNQTFGTTYKLGISGTFSELVEINNPSNTYIRLRDYDATQPRTTIITEFKIIEKSGLIAAYNMIPQNGELTDISGNENTGTIYGCKQTVDGLFSQGNDYADYIYFSTPIANDLTTWTICTKISSYVPGVNDFYVGGDSDVNLMLNRGGYLCYREEGGLFNSFNGTGNTEVVLAIDVTNSFIIWIADGINIYLYVDGVFKGYITPVNTKIYIDHIIRGYTNDYFNPELILQDFRLYNKVLTEAEIIEYSNQWNNQVYLRETFSDSGVGETLPVGWQPGTGAYEVGENSDGTKYLECATAGAIGMQSEQAYGTWEFDFYKKDSDNIYFVFINDKKVWGSPFTNTYTLSIDIDERINLLKNGAVSSMCRTAVSYISPEINYSIKITRTVTGEFTLYIKGGSFGDQYQLVDVTGGLGTNPVTDNTIIISKYIVLDSDVGDRISNIVLKKGIKI